MNSNGETKSTLAMQALEKGGIAFNNKKFSEAVKCCQLGLKFSPLSIIKYTLMQFLASSEASLLFYDGKYELALNRYNLEINKFFTEIEKIKEIAVKQVETHATRINLQNCCEALGLLYARRGQVYYFMALLNQDEEYLKLGMADFKEAGKVKFSDYCSTLQKTTQYVAENLKPLNKSLNEPNLKLFICAEKFNEGVEQLQDKKFDKAIENFEEAISYCNYDGNIWENLAEARLQKHYECKTSEEKEKILLQAIKDATEATQQQSHHTTSYLIRGVASELTHQYPAAYNDFKMAIKVEVFTQEANDEEEIPPLVKDTLKSFYCSQFKLVAEHKLKDVFLKEEKNIKSMLENDDYKNLYKVMQKVAAICEEKNEISLAENNYCTLLWMTMNIRDVRGFISEAKTSYCLAIMKGLQNRLDSITLNEVEELRNIFSSLSKNKLNSLKQQIKQFLNHFIVYSDQIKEQELGKARDLLIFVQMLSPENSQIHKQAKMKADEILQGPAKQKNKNKKQHSTSLISERIQEKENIPAPESKENSQKKKTVLLSQANIPEKMIEQLKEKEIILISESKKESQMESPALNISESEDLRSTPEPIIIEPISCELELKNPIKLPAPIWAMTHCLRAAGIQQAYLTGLSLCQIILNGRYSNTLEIVFGCEDPTTSLDNAFPQKRIVQEGSRYTMSLNENLVVFFRNSQAMNEKVRALKEPGLSHKQYRCLKSEAIKEDLKQQDLTMFALYAECDNHQVVVYDPTVEQRGLRDLKEQTFKFVRDKKLALENDPSIAWKLIYFSQQHTIDIPKNITQTVEALTQANIKNFIEKSPSDVNYWLTTLFMSGKALKSFETLRKTHLLEKIVPDFSVLSSSSLTIQSILVYLQCVLAECDTIISNNKPDIKPDINLIYATWIYALSLLKENQPSSSLPFTTSFQTLDPPSKRRLLFSAENKWKNCFFYKQKEPTANPDLSAKLIQIL